MPLFGSYFDEEKRILDELYDLIRPEIENVYSRIDRSLNSFPLPIRIDNHDEYDAKVTSELHRYLETIKNTPALVNIPNFLDEVQEVVNHILLALGCERQGETERARLYIKAILEKYQSDNFFVSELDSCYAFRGSAPFDSFRYQNIDYTKQLNLPLTFFRCRKKEVYDRDKMLHVPLNRRSWISSNRFSLPGIPCLYIATTSHCCWKELGQPEDMSIVALKVNDTGKKLRILNLVIPQHLINGVDWNPYQPLAELSKKMRRIFPLVIATSVSTRTQDNCAYKPEYTISHLIMRCLKDLKIDGVAYMSTRIDGDYQFPQSVNLAIPVFSKSTSQSYGDICKCFEMTNPMFFKSCKNYLSCQGNNSTKSYVNTVFFEGINGMIEWEHTMTPYCKTPFFNIDNILCSQTYTPVMASHK